MLKILYVNSPFNNPSVKYMYQIFPSVLCIKLNLCLSGDVYQIDI